MALSKVEVVPIRDAFKHEALDFTVWLEANIDALSERIGLELTVVEREKLVGSFKVDLYCEDSSGDTVIIENQLAPTDHDHLGKLLTYMVNLDAQIAIWVATTVRQEHQRVIERLNEVTGADMSFYFVQVEAIRIDDSPYAPLFTILAQPDEQLREVGEQKKEQAERHILRQEFWSQLLEKSQGKTQLASNRSPSRDHWLSVSMGRSGINYNYLILNKEAAIDLYIDVGDHDKNKHIFEMLAQQRDEIEAEFGDKLDWRRLDDRCASRVVKVYRGYGSLREREKWATLQDLLIDAMIRFDKGVATLRFELMRRHRTSVLPE
jgi:hypothetical protein